MLGHIVMIIIIIINFIKASTEWAAIYPTINIYSTFFRSICAV